MHDPRFPVSALRLLEKKKTENSALRLHLVANAQQLRQAAMILRWIQPDGNGKKSPPSASGSASSAPYALSHAVAHAPARKDKSRQRNPEDVIDEVGESEFNAILEEVCDTVMPRKAPKKLHAGQASLSQSPAQKSPSNPGQDVPWSTLFLKLGEETSACLTDALAQLQDIALLHPNVAPAIASVTDRLDHARRAALIAQQFSQIRGAREVEQAQSVSLRQAVSDAITLRARWLHRRKVKARLGLLDAQIQAYPTALNSLIDELINWAGGLAQDIGFAVREPSTQSPATQLLVMARVNTASIEPGQWQNVGWFLWHQLAASLGARAELQVTHEALSVTVDFGAPPAPSSIFSSQLAQDSQLDTDASAIIAGCRVLLLLGKADVHEQAHRAVSRMGLRVSACASVAQARVLLGLAEGAPAHPLPHAVVYDAIIAPEDLMLMRMSLRERYPERSMAFVELSEHVGSDFHVSQLGDASTAHVSLAAISKSLAPALVFELCKVI
jgi:hypothetical protein